MNGIQLSDISIIIPVRNNQEGINNLLDSFFKTQKRENYPKEIIIVDNLSDKEISIPAKYLNESIQISLIKCKTKGPAAARNHGATIASGNWLFFTDSDCHFTPSTLTGYLNAVTDGIAYAGIVIPRDKNSISNYFAFIHLLNPPLAENEDSPEYIVTANCLIQRNAFEKINGFDENFTLASGEDVDLGWRLKKQGKLYFANESIIQHRFENSLRSFYLRFFKYGEGLILLEKKHSIQLPIEKLLPPKLKGITSILFRYLVKKGLTNGKNKNLRK